MGGEKTFTKRFEEIGKQDVSIAGGKGASLGEMVKAGIPVPPGFVVLSSAFEEFISFSIRHPELDSGSRQENKQKKIVIASRDGRGVAISLEERNEIAPGLRSRSYFGGVGSQSLAMTIGESIDEFLKTVNKDDIKSVEKASEEIRGLILMAEMPSEISQQVIEAYRHLDTKFVAVRSSATAEDSLSAAWAGQLESYLNTTEETLVENVKECWASLFTPRAIFYRMEKLGPPHTPSRSESGHPSQEGNSESPLQRRGDASETSGGVGTISVAVVIQKMIQSEVAGIAFSVHPVTQDRSQMIIEAGYGLGEAIVSGQITPDNYIVQKHKITKSQNQNKMSLRGTKQSPDVIPDFDRESKQQKEKDLRILDKTLSTQERMLVCAKDGGTEWIPVLKSKQNQQKLSDSEILVLSELILKIENHYSFPVDVEFARENGKFYIVQSRPITTFIDLREDK